MSASQWLPALVSLAGGALSAAAFFLVQRLRPASRTAADGAPAGFLRRHPQLAGATWGATAALLVGVIAWVVLPAIRAGTQQAPAALAPADARSIGGKSDPWLAELMRRSDLARSDVGLATRAAHALLERQRFAEASTYVRRALALDPFQLESRIHRAVLQAHEGDPGGALMSLGQLAQAHPEAHEALLFRGLIAMQGDQPQLALESLQRYAGVVPAGERIAQLDEILEMLRARLAQAPQP